MKNPNSSHYNFVKKAIGQRIVILRKLKGYTQAELAGICGKKPQSLERVENGKVNPSIEFLLAIAIGLGVPLTELVDIPIY